MPSFLSYAEGLTAYLDWPGTLKACTTTAYVHNFFKTGSLYDPDSPGTHYAEQADLRFIEVHLLLTTTNVIC